MDAVTLVASGLQYLINYNNYFTILCTVISFFVLKRIIWIPFKLYLLAQYLPGVDLRKKGKWAVVTGSTDGIGKAYARALASRGLDIVLISRSDEKLEKVKQGIIRDYGCAVQIIQADFSQTGIYEKIEKELEGLDIGVLINNVGTSHPFRPFLKLGNLATLTDELLTVNCTSAVQMTSLVLPRMAAKGKGVIVNISSVLTYLADGNVSIYAATKSFLLTLANSIRFSYTKQPGIIIQTLTPGITLTNLLPIFLSDMDLESGKKIAVTPEKLVAYAINTIGWANVCDGHPFHWLVARLLTIKDYL